MMIPSSFASVVNIAVVVIKGARFVDVEECVLLCCAWVEGCVGGLGWVWDEVVVVEVVYEVVEF